MLWPISVTDVAIRFAAAAFSLAIAVWTLRTRRDVRGYRAFGWLELAVALWCGTSGLHGMVSGLPAKIAISQVQYIGVSAVPPLWFLFARAYADRDRASSSRWSLAMWIVPVLTVLIAFTSTWQHWLWRDVVPAAGLPGGVAYLHGPWFWVAAGYSYLLLAAGTWSLVAAQQRFPGRYRAQTAALLIGAAIPWIENVLYVGQLVRRDDTPVAFAISGVCLAWALLRAHLFDLVPIARDRLFDSMTDAVFGTRPPRPRAGDERRGRAAGRRHGGHRRAARRNGFVVASTGRG